MENPNKIGTDECIYRRREEILTGESATTCNTDACLPGYRHYGKLGERAVIKCDAPRDKT